MNGQNSVKVLVATKAKPNKDNIRSSLDREILQKLLKCMSIFLFFIFYSNFYKLHALSGDPMSSLVWAMPSFILEREKNIL